jgi:hypothetical protein
MKLTDANLLLARKPLRLETGYERLEDGVLHIACRTDMHGCTGEMFEWWFRFRPNTQQYVWWHPVDHVSSTWETSEAKEGTHVGSIHVVEERFTGQPAAKLSIQFRDPNEFFDSDAYAQARRGREVTAAVVGRVGFSHQPKRGPRGEVIGGRLLHIARDTDWGMCLRSHFFLGQDLPSLGMKPADVEKECPDDFGEALLQHCYNEFTFLSRFLPSLYLGENRDRTEVTVPW